MPKVTPFLWFDDQAEEAAELYVSVFNGRPGSSGDSEILGVSRYGEARPGTPGSAMTVSLRLEGQEITGLNGGPDHTFTDAFSFFVHCETQEEVDHFWAALTEGGEEGPCGWLKDRFGLSWQVVPSRLSEFLSSSDRGVAERTAAALFSMKKIVIADLEAAAADLPQPA
jgi:predicted 3-demethylubiquinone-9 3-methyltransferase (glyoxalase superfamily)